MRANLNCLVENHCAEMGKWGRRRVGWVEEGGGGRNNFVSLPTYLLVGKNLHEEDEIFFSLQTRLKSVENEYV